MKSRSFTNYLLAVTIFSTSNGYKTNGKLSQDYVIWRFNFTNTNAPGFLLEEKKVFCYYVCSLYQPLKGTELYSSSHIMILQLAVQKKNQHSHFAKKSRLVVIFSRQTISTQIQSTIEPNIFLLNKGTNSSLCLPCWQLKKQHKKRSSVRKYGENAGKVMAGPTIYVYFVGIMYILGETYQVISNNIMK